MFNFERSGLSQKLTIISVLSTGSALMLVFIAFAATSVLSRTDDERKQLSTLAGVIGSNSAPALLEADRRQAAQALSTLEVEDEIQQAALYDSGGQLLARYTSAARRGVTEVPQHLAALDALRLDGSDLRSRPYRERYTALAATVPNTASVRVAEAAWDEAGKGALYDRIAAQGGEGVVFKRADGLSVAGRPASGGSQVKCKFYATCTCLVSARNDQRSVRLSLTDEAGRAVAVGSVTIPSNKPIPEPGALVEIRYLYAYPGGSLYQPAYLGERDDLDVTDCTLGQLKLKPMGYNGEEES